MLAKALTAIFIGLGLSSAVMAQPRVYLEAEDGVTFDVKGEDDAQGVSSYHLMGVNRDLDIYLPDGNPHCTMSGRLDADGDSVSFRFTSGEAYLHPCGSNGGVTLTCSDPVSVC
ncbi:hypothetical protein IAT38_005314 [Cryptococcus sp. DSM 104549]